MIRVVVVDDEPYLLRSIRQSIEQAHPDFSVVGEALDGEQALAVINHVRPDIVFTDIRMPVTDGLQLIEELRKRNCDALPVILSGYQDFDYAQRAVRLDVVDYLLKPIHPESLAQLLEELRGKVEDRKRKRQQEVLESIIRSRADCRRGQREVERLFSPYKGYTCLYLCAGSYRMYATARLVPATERWRGVDFDAVISKQLGEGERYWIIGVDRTNEKIIVIGSAVSQASRSFDCASRIHHALDRRAPPLTTVVGVFTGDVCELSPYIQSMRGSLMHMSVFGRSMFIRHSAASSEVHGGLRSLAPLQEKVFRVLIHNRLRPQLDLEVKRVLDACEAGRCTQYMLERQLRRICMLLYDFRGDACTPEERIESLLSEAENYSDIHDGVQLLMDDIFSHDAPGDDYADTIEETIKKIDEYFLLNFTTPMSLEAVARIFGMTQSYFSSVYKKLRGMTPLKRITQLRIEKAKELLSIQPRIAIKEISDAIGYDDPYYFSRLFRTVVGQSPSHFRADHGFSATGNRSF